MKAKKILMFGVLFVFVLTSIAFAMEWTGFKGSEGWGWGMPYQNMYNPKGMETYSGEVISVDTVVPMKGMSPAVHLMLLTKDKKTVSVHLGPAWFIERLDTPIKRGDQIEVKGSMVTMTIQEKPEFKSEHVLIASEVRKDDKVLQLRDALGEPIWAGWKKMEEKK